MNATVVVVDVSFALKWVITEPHTPEARQLLATWTAAVVGRISPELFAYESANALYRKRPQADGIRWTQRNLAGLLSAVSLRPSARTVLDRAVAIAEELNRPAAYDSQYAALAEAEGCEFWTADERFWNSAKPRFPWVRWVGERSAQRRGR